VISRVTTTAYWLKAFRHDVARLLEPPWDNQVGLTGPTATTAAISTGHAQLHSESDFATRQKYLLNRLYVRLWAV